MRLLRWTLALGASIWIAMAGLAGMAAPVAAAALGPTHGYWEVASDGGIFSFGGAPFYGSLGGQALASPVVGIAPTPDRGGYWEVEADGDVFPFGDAQPSLQAVAETVAMTAFSKDSYIQAGSDGTVVFQGGTFANVMSGRDFAHNEPIVGMAADPPTQRLGYWLVGSDGGVFAFGSANFYGSMGGQPLNKPIVGMASTPDGGGYWLVASDGGIFTFGDANFYGSMGGQPLNKPIVGIASTPDGAGYWLVASDGGIFSFGDANFSGSMGGKALNAPITGMAAVP